MGSDGWMTRNDSYVSPIRMLKTERCFVIVVIIIFIAGEKKPEKSRGEIAAKRRRYRTAESSSPMK